MPVEQPVLERETEIERQRHTDRNRENNAICHDLPNQEAFPDKAENTWFRNDHLYSCRPKRSREQAKCTFP